MHMISLILVLACAVDATPASASPLKPPRHGGIYVVAHRGAHEGIPENTLAAYQKAIDLGVDFVEIDVRATKDGKFVSIHNDEVDGYAPGAKGAVKDLTFDEIRALDVGSRVGPEWKGTQIPTFEEILDLCKGKAGIYLDLKNAPIEKLVPLIKARGMERDIVWYIGPGQIPLLHKECPECIEMPEPATELMLPSLLESFKPRVISGSYKSFTKGFAEKCHAAGVPVIVDDDGPTSWTTLIECGVDGIQTDHPADLIKFLEERAAHPAK